MCQAIPEVSKLNITVNKVGFIQDKAMYGGGVYMHVLLLPCTAEYIQIHVSFCDVIWNYNEANTAGAAVYIENVLANHDKSTTVTVDFIDIGIYHSGKDVYQKWYWHDKLSILEFNNIVQVNFITVSSPSIEFHHSSGPVVIATNTDIVLAGSLTFHTIHGGRDATGFSLEELSHLVIQEPTTLFIQLPDSAFPLSSLITALGRPYMVAIKIAP